GFALKVETHQTLQRKVLLAHAQIGAVDLAVERLEQRDGVLRHAVRRVGGHAGDGEPQLAGGVEVDVVETRATQRDMAHARGGERGEGVALEIVVYEHADSPRALRAGERGRPETKFMEPPVDLARSGR